VNRRQIVFLLTLVAVVAFVNVVCQAQSKTLLTRHVREATLNGQAPLVGRLPVTQTMHVDIVLAVSHQAELDNFVKEVSDPKSSSYRHYLTVPEFTEKFGPSQQDYDSLISFVKANGFTVLGGSRDSMDVRLEGPVDVIERAFHVTMGLYKHPTENRNFYAPDREPTVDLPFQLWHISGLDNYALPHPLFVKRDLKVQPLATTGSCPGQSFCGSDMRAAYYEGSALTGAGQNVGLLEYAGYDIQDVNTYYQGAGQTLYVNVVGISTDGTPVLCTEADGCDDTEQTLDITQAAGMAPNLSNIFVYVGSTDTALLSAMASDTPLPANLSSSWSWSPADPSTDNPIFQKMIAQGQTYFQASGDGGAYEGSSPWPMNSPYVQTVGGTDLETTGPGGDWASETAWVDGGGGWGTNEPIPSWQQVPGVITTANKGSTAYRNTSDVSANANFTFYVCADQSGLSGCTENDYGGTSFAAPMWAGYISLVNENLANNGYPPVGFINPTIYTDLGLGPGYDTDFHDVVSGNDGLPTTPGYDLPTGWGSPNTTGLINAFLAEAGPNFGLSASPSSILVIQGSNANTTVTVNKQNGFTGNVTLSVTGLPSGVTYSFSPNPASSSSTLTLTASASATAGTVIVTILGTSGSLTNATTLSLTVAPTVSGAELSLTPGSLAFGTVVVEASSAAKKATFTNNSSTTVYFSIITTSANFSQTNTCGSTLAAGKSCTISVIFTPTQVGALTGTLSVNDNGTNSPQTVSLSGTGKAQAALTPATATYSATVVGKSSAAKTFTLKNNQNVILKNVSVSTTGPFSVTSNTCGTQLTSNASCTISVVFTPTGVGVETGTLQVSDNAVGSPQVSNLTGTGKE
jgi:subtilase family serine protease